ncbi:MAG: hypothetical protein E6K79_08285 [Candidatus Eisenbacteria bacterium]|uniref:Soluble ligand binding domain-containing protein n=1 Tax=Eiseniibacteriota bacterium TaxID=2212470 RepID=A0A538TKJ2_UNCEI|nr:MAG: hypothetical protein E6K79_08285 [Candidatus Eisenbacteria bacterium]
MARLFDGDVLTNLKTIPDKHSAVRTTSTSSRSGPRRPGSFLGACLGAAAALALACGSARAQTSGEDVLRTLPEGVTMPPGDGGASPSAGSRPTLAGPVDPATYRLGPGDVLSLEYGGKALAAKVLTVDAEGRVRVPNLGLVALGGKTLADARADIIQRLRPYVPGASLDLRLLEPRTFNVYVLGEVKTVGTKQVSGDARVLEAIEAAGGTTPNASRRNIRLLHRDGHADLADLERFERTGDWDGNPYLQDGDRVIVPVLTERIGVFGAIARASFYEFRNGDSLGTLLRIAGGLLPEARVDSVVIVRFRGARELDTLYTSLDQGSDGEAIAMQADDRVFIRPQPEWHPIRQVTVSGEVRAPGTYPIDEGRSRVSDLVVWAGGFTPHAAARIVRLERDGIGTASDVEFERLNRLSRGEMTNSEYQTFRSKLAVRQSAYLVDFSSGRPSPPEADVPLRDGDHVHVPRLELAVRVDGSVRSPGMVAFQAGWSAGDYIHMSGGTTRRGNAGDARLTHSGSSNTVFARDTHRIEPGDFIWVPERKDTSFWAVFRDVIIVTGQVATTVLVIHQVTK